MGREKPQRLALLGAEGIEGASMIAGGLISGTSNMSMGFCGKSVEGYEAEYFRLAY